MADKKEIAAEPSKEQMDDFKKKAKELGFTVTDNTKAGAKKTESGKGGDDKGKEKGAADEDEWFNPLRGSGFFQKRTLGFTKTYGDSLANKVCVREFVDADVEGAVIVTGFPSTSLASILTAGYLREQLKLPLIGVISSYAFQPRCIIERGLPSHSVRIFGDKRLVVVLCEFKIPSPELIHTLTEALLDFAERHKSPTVITVEGLPPSEEKETKLHFISTDKSLSENLIAGEHKALEEAVVGGVTGALLAEGSLSPTVGVATLLCPSSSAFPDADSAVTVVKVVNDYLISLGHDDVNVDLAPLQAKAGELQNTLQSLISQEKETSRANSSIYT
eukprot:TRINITY_DN405_c0_g1_i1.p1 TRINITY_DN405_c0_g1~~TRINITY_DN405_c0_g1_i1.p1  ORF type:complete len:333 (+),score=89.71 TRINITY_DN405_c0_g1_i1:133-1131(+)